MKCDCQSKGHGHKLGECKKEAAESGICRECSEAQQLDWNIRDGASEKAVKMRAESGPRPKSETFK